ncbi:MAG: molybdopterin-dependent oxidoreductase [Elusimicrobia bacterium]|nr:molybdopterin-dependent oxidoreductase [Elusimicrobiota bacterium]
MPGILHSKTGLEKNLTPSPREDLTPLRAKLFYLAGENLPQNVKPEFVIVQDMILTDNAAKIADVVLPSAGYFEIEGSLTNFEGRVQAFDKIVEPRGEAKPDWWIVSQIAAKMEVPGFDWKSAKDIQKAMGSGLQGNGVRSSFVIPAKAGIQINEDLTPGPAAARLAPELCNFSYRSVKLISEIKGIETICKAKKWTTK